MSVSATLSRLGIGMFQFFAKLNKSKFQLNSNIMEVSHFFIFCIFIILKICGDMEFNPGPRKDKSYDKFSLCHWNLNNIAAHDLKRRCINRPSCKLWLL